MQNKQEKPDFQALLIDAVNQPGKMLEAYRAFHNFSIGNQLLALGQCYSRGIKPAPLATFKTWEKRGRRIKKGEKAISLYMPMIGKKEKTNDKGQTEESTFAFFRMVNRWFILSQTDGDTFDDMSLVQWDKEKALKALDIQMTDFDSINGNIQGFARGRQVAINPLAQLPFKTLFHEMAHVLLGHTDEVAMAAHDETIPACLMEVEAESVAMLCLASLNMDGMEYCRGYIQNWISTESIPEKSCRKIMSVADKILKAGTNKLKENGAE